VRTTRRSVHRASHVGLPRAALFKALAKAARAPTLPACPALTRRQRSQLASLCDAAARAPPRCHPARHDLAPVRLRHACTHRAPRTRARTLAPGLAGRNFDHDGAKCVVLHSQLARRVLLPCLRTGAWMLRARRSIAWPDRSSPPFATPGAYDLRGSNRSYTLHTWKALLCTDGPAWMTAQVLPSRMPSSRLGRPLTRIYRPELAR
jgi:hypothetical protein